jgi:hypothetical protein
MICPRCGLKFDESTNGRAAVSVQELREWCQANGEIVFPIDRISPSTAAKILGLSQSTMKNKRCLGQLPGVRIGGRGRLTYKLSTIAQALVEDDWA